MDPLKEPSEGLLRFIDGIGLTGFREPSDGSVLRFWRLEGAALLPDGVVETQIED
jgi:hypothetical protein